MNRDDASAILGDLEEGRLGKVKVLARRVAPTTCIGVACPIGRTKVGGRHQYGGVAWQTPFFLIPAPDLEARTTTQPKVEQGGAQRRSVGAKT